MNINSKSEIILNKDGSIYHLHLHNSDIASRIITVGDQQRVEEVVAHFDSVRLRRANREFITVTGCIGNTELTVISTGIGTDNIDVVFNELQLVHQYNLEQRQPFTEKKKALRIVRLGTSGTLQNHIAVDSLLISEAALSFDGLFHFYENNFPRPELGLGSIPAPFLTRPDSGLFDKFKSMCQFTGCTVTAAGFYAPQGRHIIAAPKSPDFLKHLATQKVEGLPVTNLEMETAGIYGLGALLGMRTVSISAILANRISGEFSQQATKTVGNMIKEALQILVEED